MEWFVATTPKVGRCAGTGRTLGASIGWIIFNVHFFFTMQVTRRHPLYSSGISPESNYTKLIDMVDTIIIVGENINSHNMHGHALGSRP